MLPVFAGPPCGDTQLQEGIFMIKGIASGIFWSGVVVGAVVASLIALML